MRKHIREIAEYGSVLISGVSERFHCIVIIAENWYSRLDELNASHMLGIIHYNT